MTDESMAVRPARSPRGRARGGWRVPAGLIALSLIPLVAGALRMTELAGGPVIMPETRALAPLPLALHILGVSAYAILGAFQFVPRLRRRRNGWHRRAGRLLVGCGLLAALTGMWMSLFHGRPEDGGLLLGFRLVFGAAMAVSIVLGFAAIRRRDVSRHRAWMIRGYAIGLGAGTQAFTQLPWDLFFGAPGELPRALLMAAAWVINLMVAEWVIRRWPVQAVPAR
ncbi:DUF2306 domain-containing protein [Nonomuraea sp. K274]|uniref:DUF2306 domain-containing protein n=1 Tax=Nonomuraea cypriaca TaxID=1187855 RepID=A0A931AG98_9ACTN|nr:DUF2306 domain-containing protein [Nonomuraea cypriaca]MBF8191085.1 DUF2306 domain-containing protein [Nonomuraea cypriaca]